MPMTRVCTMLRESAMLFSFADTACTPTPASLIHVTTDTIKDEVRNITVGLLQDSVGPELTCEYRIMRGRDAASSLEAVSDASSASRLRTRSSRFAMPVHNTPACHLPQHKAISSSINTHSTRPNGKVA